LRASRQESVDAAALSDYFKCPEELVTLSSVGCASTEQGYFSFGGATCYGRVAGIRPSPTAARELPKVDPLVDAETEEVRLPFSLHEIVSNLRGERYALPAEGVLGNLASSRLARSLYYFARPLLSVPVRKHLQRARFSDWRDVPFPSWPVDTSVDDVMLEAAKLMLKASGLPRLPFIWFWPEGAPACVMMTHDVEGPAGVAFCDRLMDLDESFRIRSSFQLVPERRYDRVRELWDRIGGRGFEANLHDVRHDGSLFKDERGFREQAQQINQYASAFGARGFRSAAMYRRQDWLQALDVSYDMSVPSVAHLEPQRGGCCTVMPYFVGRVLELPLTTIQDYSLFHILGDYSIELWKTQIQMILSKHGLVSFLTHPDYLSERTAREVYEGLLSHIYRLCTERRVWIALPGEVDKWWRNRNRMRLVEVGEGWRVEGPDCGHARIAFASLRGEQLVCEVERAT
jgi:hypothetical protein